MAISDQPDSIHNWQCQIRWEEPPVFRRSRARLTWRAKPSAKVRVCCCTQADPISASVPSRWKELSLITKSKPSNRIFCIRSFSVWKHQPVSETDLCYHRCRHFSPSARVFLIEESSPCENKNCPTVSSVGLSGSAASNQTVLMLNLP